MKRNAYKYLASLLAVALGLSAAAHATVYTWDDEHATDKRINRSVNWDPDGLPTGGHSGVVNSNYVTWHQDATYAGYQISYNDTSSLSGYNDIISNIRVDQGMALAFNDSSSFSIGRLFVGYSSGTGSVTMNEDSTGTLGNHLFFGSGTYSSTGVLALSGNAALTSALSLYVQGASQTHTLTLSDAASLVLDGAGITVDEGNTLIVNFEQPDTTYTPSWSMGTGVDFNNPRIQYQINGTNTTLVGSSFVLTTGSTHDTLTLSTTAAPHDMMWDGGHATDDRINLSANWDPDGLPTGGLTGVVSSNDVTWHQDTTYPGYQITYNDTSTLSGYNDIISNIRVDQGMALTFNDSSSFSIARLFVGYSSGTGSVTMNEDSTGTLSQHLFFGSGTAASTGVLALSGNAALTSALSLYVQGASQTHTLTLSDAASLVLDGAGITVDEGNTLIVNFEQPDTTYTPSWSMGTGVDFNNPRIQYQINGMNTTLADFRFVQTTDATYETLSLETNLAFSGAYPRLFTSDAEKDGIVNQISFSPYKTSSFDLLKNRVDPYVAIHQTNENWIISRLPMNREPGKRYIGYTNLISGVTNTIYAGYGDAPVPTLMFTAPAIPGHLVAENLTAMSVPLVDVTPYASNLFLVDIRNLSTGEVQRELVDQPTASYTFSSTINEIEQLALDSAFLYWLTGEETYGKFASDIVLTIADTTRYQTNILRKADGSLATGGAAYPVGNIFIQFQLAETLAQGMDYLHGYFVANGIDFDAYRQAVENVGGFMAEDETATHNIGVRKNNVKMQLALIMSGNTTWSEPYLESIHRGLDAQTLAIDTNGVWVEPCGYSDITAGYFMETAYMALNNGIDLLEEHPEIFLFGKSQTRDIYPNSRYFGDGDNWTAYPKVYIMETAVALARKLGRTSDEIEFSQYMNYQIDEGRYHRGSGTMSREILATHLSSLDYPSLGINPLLPSVRNPTRETLGLRNGYESETGLQAFLYGTMYTHQHNQGMTLELYGCGEILGVDPGPATDAYGGPLHNGYATRYAAHNTVVVDGASDGFAHLTNGIMEPEDATLPVSDSFSFMKGDSTDLNSGAAQRRLTAVVRTSPSTGYYLDIFHSAGATKNDYLYHNVGTTVDVYSGAQQLAGTSVPAELNDDTIISGYNRYPGYVFFTNKMEYAIGTSDASILFTTPYTGQETVFMNMFVPGGSDRRIFSAEAPAAYRGTPEYNTVPQPTVVIRKTGEAWSQPFVAVYEPFRGLANQSVAEVSVFAPAVADDRFTGVSALSPVVPGATGSVTDLFFSATTSSIGFTNTDWAFQGLFGAVRTVAGSVEELYLGKGTALQYDDFRLDSPGGDVAASLYYVENDKLMLRANGPVRVSFPAPANVNASAPAQLLLIQDGATNYAQNVVVENSEYHAGKLVVSGLLPAANGGELLALSGSIMGTVLWIE